MNLLIAPFHDWRKILLEGSRTRDAHFIDEFAKDRSMVKILINRPTTPLEILLKRKRNLIKGDVVHKKKGFTLYKIEKNFYVIDYISYDMLNQMIFGYKWFIYQYGNHKLINYINETLIRLKIENDYHLLNQNIFASKLTKALHPKTSVFDAWDNFAKFNTYAKIKEEIEVAYHTYSNRCDFWITNSKDNIQDFTKKYNLKNIILITNGLDVSRFEDSTAELPEDMRNIPRPIIGFGGKITQLIDVDLLNETMRRANEVSFVFVGQILDKDVFSRIEKLNNFHYLGDKHYDVYPNYVKNFDVCIVPYVVKEEKKSGANTIKVYEYLATKKKVIGTNSNGLEDLKEYLYTVTDATEFAYEITNGINTKKQIDLDFYSWKNKISYFIKLIR